MMRLSEGNGFSRAARAAGAGCATTRRSFAILPLSKGRVCSSVRSTSFRTNVRFLTFTGPDAVKTGENRTIARMDSRQRGGQAWYAEHRATGARWLTRADTYAALVGPRRRLVGDLLAHNGFGGPASSIS